MHIQRPLCLVLFKPLGMTDPIHGEILLRLQEKGVVITKKTPVIKKHDIELLYEKSGRDSSGEKLPHFEPIVKYLSGKRLAVLVLEGEGDPETFIQSINEMIGPWECHKAREDQIRHIPVSRKLMYMVDIKTVEGKFFRCTDNLLHSSDSLESAIREIPIWFPSLSTI